MNLKSFLYSTGVLLVAGSGCKKLDVEPIGSAITESQYYQTVEQCKSSTQVAYTYIDYSGSWWQTLNWRYLSGEAASDNAWMGNTYQPSGTAYYQAVTHYTLDAGNDRNEAMWVELYKSIGVFNSMMQDIEAAPIDEASKKQFIAELKFLRSWCYFDLVRNWGDVPLVLKIYSPDVHLPRTPVKDVYNQIVTDLKECASILPKKSEYSSADKFRASKGAALALLAKTYLYMEDWANAETSAKQVMGLGDYTLEPTFGTLWNYNYKNGVESIFEIQYASSLSPRLPSNGYNVMCNSTVDGGWGFYSLSSDLENAFKSEGDSIRLQWTMNRQGLPVAGDPNTPSFDAHAWPYGASNSTTQNKSGRMSRKHYTPKSQRPSNGLYAFNDKILRFADVLLIHAEACAMQNKTGEALSSLKKIRDRVSLPTDMTLSGWNLTNAVRKERRLELAFEGDRLYDLRRWKDQSGKPVIDSIFGPNGSFVKYNTQVSTDPFETKNTKEPQNKGYYFDPAVHHLWPIPMRELIYSNGVVTQNPGYQ
jgi:hypothetical protein